MDELLFNNTNMYPYGNNAQT